MGEKKSHIRPQRKFRFGPRELGGERKTIWRGLFGRSVPGETNEAKSTGGGKSEPECRQVTTQQVEGWEGKGSIRELGGKTNKGTCSMGSCRKGKLGGIGMDLLKRKASLPTR